MVNDTLKTEKLVTMFKDSCIGRGLSKETIRWYCNYLVRFSQVYPDLPQDPNVIESYIGTYKGDEVRHGCYRSIKTFYNFLEKRLKLSNPINQIYPPQRSHKEKLFPSLVEIKKILEYPGHDKIIRAALYVLVDTGSRIGEIWNLCSDDILDSGVRVNGKTGQRLIPVSPSVIKMLRDLGHGKLFPYSISCFDRKVSKAITKAGFPQFTPHSLRHAFASNWNGSDLSLKVIGGWRSWTMVEHYSHRKLEKAREEHAVQGPISRLYGSQNMPSQKTPSGGVVPPQGDYQLARNLFYYHALLSNIGKNLLYLFKDYGEKHIVKKFCLVNLLRDAFERNEIRILEANAEKILGDFISRMSEKELDEFLSPEASSMWNILAWLIEPFIAENELKAKFYRDMAIDDTEIEEVSFNDIATLWQK